MTSRDPERSSRDPNTLRVQYRENTWKCYFKMKFIKNNLLLIIVDVSASTEACVETNGREREGTQRHFTLMIWTYAIG